MTKLRYTAEQANILEAQYATWESVYKLSQDGNEWAQTVIKTLPVRIGDKWNSMANNVIQWAQDTAEMNELETYIREIHPGYIRSEMRSTWRKRFQNK